MLLLVLVVVPQQRFLRYDALHPSP
jgi:hypothetical protein